MTAVTCDARRTVTVERQLPRHLRVLRGMAYCLLLRYDSDGPCPVLLRDDERLDGNGARARYRFIASTESWAEAKAIMDLVCKAMEARELSLGEILGLAGEAVQRAVGR